MRWEPDIDTTVAVLSALAMIPLYYLSVHLTGTLGTAAVIVQMVVLGVIFPVWWLAWYRKKPLADLGIHKSRWIVSLVAGMVIAILFFFRLMAMYSGPDIVPHLIVNACMFWEPFFVYGWLLLCFDRAFGIIPGILFSALAFGAYHIGTYPADGILMLIVVGIIFGCIFRTTGNILILWPFAWAVSSSMGTAMGGMIFGWDSIGTSIAVLVLSLAFIGYTAKIKINQLPVQ
jgi:membrane protease YdiL (CAAX protease family)